MLLQLVSFEGGNWKPRERAMLLYENIWII
jgi:hypothetical protein